MRVSAKVTLCNYAGAYLCWRKAKSIDGVHLDKCRNIPCRKLARYGQRNDPHHGKGSLQAYHSKKDTPRQEGSTPKLPDTTVRQTPHLRKEHPGRAHHSRESLCRNAWRLNNANGFEIRQEEGAVQCRCDHHGQSDLKRTGDSKPIACKATEEETHRSCPGISDIEPTFLHLKDSPPNMTHPCSLPKAPVRSLGSTSSATYELSTSLC